MRTSAVNDPGEYKVLVNAEVSTDRVADQNQDVLLPLRKDGITEGDKEDKEVQEDGITEGDKEDKEMQIPVNTEVVIIGHFENPYEENKTPVNAVLAKMRARRCKCP